MLSYLNYAWTMNSSRRLATLRHAQSRLLSTRHVPDSCKSLLQKQPCCAVLGASTIRVDKQSNLYTIYTILLSKHSGSLTGHDTPPSDGILLRSTPVSPGNDRHLCSSPGDTVTLCCCGAGYDGTGSVCLHSASAPCLFLLPHPAALQCICRCAAVSGRWW